MTQLCKSYRLGTKFTLLGNDWNTSKAINLDYLDKPLINMLTYKQKEETEEKGWRKQEERIKLTTA